METEELQSDKNNKEETREIPKGTHKIIHSGFSQRKPRGATEMLHFWALCYTTGLLLRFSPGSPQWPRP